MICVGLQDTGLDLHHVGHDNDTLKACCQTAWFVTMMSLITSGLLSTVSTRCYVDHIGSGIND